MPPQSQHHRLEREGRQPHRGHRIPPNASSSFGSNTLTVIWSEAQSSFKNRRSGTSGSSVTLALLIPASAQAAPSLSIPVAGTAIGGGAFSGVFTLTSFAVRDGQVVALGTVSGILTDAGGIVGSVLATVALPTRVGASTCEILHLDLGPIVLDLTAQTGAGNLLGTL